MLVLRLCSCLVCRHVLVEASADEAIAVLSTGSSRLVLIRFSILIPEDSPMLDHALDYIFHAFLICETTSVWPIDAGRKRLHIIIIKGLGGGGGRRGGNKVSMAT